MSTIKNWNELITLRNRLKEEGKKVVFTNGVFDIVHSGHVDYLTKTKAFGDVLIVGINSDASVKKIKGEKRPILSEKERTFIISSLKPVDYVTLFDEETPAKLIEEVIPDVIVKGADWAIDKIIGADIVLSHGGEVKTIEFVNNQSTTKIIQTILDRYKS